MMQLEPKIFILLLGFFFSATGVAGLSGRYKRWYWNSRRMVYAYFPFGILFILAAVGQTYSDPGIGRCFYIAEIAVFAVAAWWALWPPRFIRPAWIRRIEACPKEVYETMVKSVKDGKEWHSKVETSDSLEKWIRTIEKNIPKK
jgi:hypothetical protein